MLNAAVLNPMASAREDMARTVTPGFRSSVRMASRREREKRTIMYL